MRRRRIARALPLLLALAGGCHETRLLEPLPLLGATPVPVTMSTADAPAGALPRLAITPVAGGVELQWDVAETCAIVAQASGERSGDVLAVYLRRQPNALMSCAPAQIAHRYLLRVAGLSAGRYTVRFADILGDAAPHETARQVVTVSAA